MIKNKVKQLEFWSWDKIKDLKFNQLKDNSNRDVKKLKKSIKERGFFSPFFVWNDYVFDGTGRMQAIEELIQDGETIPDLPVLKVEAKNLSEAKIYALQMSSRHGNITQESLYEFTIDIPEVETLIDEVTFYEFDMEFGEPEVEELPPEQGQDDIPEIKKEPFVVRGDIFEIKAQGLKYRVGCLDSTSIDDLNKLFKGERIDLVFTDPPYGVDITKNKKGSAHGVLGELPEIAGDKDTTVAKEFYQTCQSLNIQNYIIWGGNYFTDFLPPSRCWLVWDKEVGIDFSFAGGELAWCSMDKNTKIFRQTWSGNLDGKIDLETEGLERELMNGSSRVNRTHPTQKPVQMQKDILNWLDPKTEIKSIYDGFVGGGSMILVGIQTKRNVFASEITEYYTQVTVERVINFLRKNEINFEITLNGKDFDISKLG